MSSQYGELRPTSGWDRSGSLRHPCKFQRQRYCTASSSGRQPNFAALNRGRHLCSAGRPSPWALVHILVGTMLLWIVVNTDSVCSQGQVFKRAHVKCAKYFILGYIMQMIFTQFRYEYSKSADCISFFLPQHIINEMMTRSFSCIAML